MPWLEVKYSKQVLTAMLQVLCPSALDDICSLVVLHQGYFSSSPINGNLLLQANTLAKPLDEAMQRRVAIGQTLSCFLQQPQQGR